MNLFNRELPLRKGDSVYLLHQIDRNWFKGERHGTVGIFPVNYVQVSNDVGYLHSYTLLFSRKMFGLLVHYYTSKHKDAQNIDL